MKDYAETGGARTCVAERATADAVMWPHSAERMKDLDVERELTTVRTAAGQDEDRRVDFSENSDAARELTIASRPSGVRRFVQKIC